MHLSLPSPSPPSLSLAHTHTHLVLCIHIGSLAAEKPHNGVVTSDSCHVQSRLSLLVGHVKRAACLHQALHHTLVTMPTATEKGRVSLLNNNREYMYM